MKYTVEIQNLKCGGCAKTVIKKMESFDAVEEAWVDVAKSEVTVEMKNEEALPELEKALVEIGYPPVGEKNSVITKAKSFVSCASGKMSS